MWLDEETILESIEGGLDLGYLRHAKQTAVALDQCPFRALIGGRRSGKTREVVTEFLEVADRFPGLIVPYVATTVGTALDVVMPELYKLEQEYNLKLDYNLSDHKIFTPNGGCVKIAGLSTEAEVEKGRGPSLPALFIDEAGHQNQRLLQRAVQETWGPATRDWTGRGGRGIMLSGTPDYVPDSYWFKVCGGNEHVSKYGASVHHMTIFDNPFFAGREEETIEAYCTENGLKRSDSKVQREWYGRFAVDADGLAYPHWDGIVHPIQLMPVTGFTTLGLDMGHSPDPCAWVVIRWVMVESVEANRVRWIHHGHVLESYEETNLNIHDVAAITREFQQTYNVSVTHGDSAGGGKMTIESLKDVFGIAIDPVVKSGHKQDRIWMLDSMLGNRTMHVHDRAQSFAEQLRSVPKERGSNGLYDHMRGYNDHSLDAAHYAILAARQQPIELDLGNRLRDRKADPEAMNGGRRSELMRRLAGRRAR